MSSRTIWTGCGVLLRDRHGRPAVVARLRAVLNLSSGRVTFEQAQTLDSLGNPVWTGYPGVPNEFVEAVAILFYHGIVEREAEARRERVRGNGRH